MIYTIYIHTYVYLYIDGMVDIKIGSIMNRKGSNLWKSTEVLGLEAGRLASLASQEPVPVPLAASIQEVLEILFRLVLQFS